MASVDIVKERVPFNWGQFIAIIVFCITSTFTITKIVDRFESVEKQQALDQKLNKEAFEAVYQYIKEMDEDQTRRLDTKTKRNSDAVQKIADELEKSGSK